MKLHNQLHFAQKLSLLVDSGISLAEALEILKKIEKQKSRERVYDLLLEDVFAGVSLSKSLAQRNISCEKTLFALIETGELSGSLGACLKQAYEYLEKKNELKKKVIGSLVYPAFIVCATVGMTLFLILFIFPKIMPLLTSLNIALPLITRVVLRIYHLSIAYGLQALLSLGLGFALLVCLVRGYARARFVFHRSLLSLPIFGKLMQMYLLSSTFSTGYILLSSGRSLHDMLIFSKNSSRNLLYRRSFGRVALECAEGVSLATSLAKDSKLFPQLSVSMVTIGEKTGNLSLMLLHTGKLYGEELESSLKKFSSLIEPLLMILMGLVVGSIALSIILPVYEITNHLNQ